MVSQNRQTSQNKSVSTFSDLKTVLEDGVGVDEYQKVCEEINNNDTSVIEKDSATDFNTCIQTLPRTPASTEKDALTRQFKLLHKLYEATNKQAFRQDTYIDYVYNLSNRTAIPQKNIDKIITVFNPLKYHRRDIDLADAAFNESGLDLAHNINRDEAVRYLTGRLQTSTRNNPPVIFDMIKQADDTYKNKHLFSIVLERLFEQQAWSSFVNVKQAMDQSELNTPELDKIVPPNKQAAVLKKSATAGNVPDALEKYLVAAIDTVRASDVEELLDYIEICETYEKNFTLNLDNFEANEYGSEYSKDLERFIINTDHHKEALAVAKKVNRTQALYMIKKSMKNGYNDLFSTMLEQCLDESKQEELIVQSIKSANRSSVGIIVDVLYDGQYSKLIVTASETPAINTSDFERIFNIAKQEEIDDSIGEKLYENVRLNQESVAFFDVLHKNGFNADEYGVETYKRLKRSFNYSPKLDWFEQNLSESVRAALAI